MNQVHRINCRIESRTFLELVRFIATPRYRYGSSAPSNYLPQYLLQTCQPLDQFNGWNYKIKTRIIKIDETSKYFAFKMQYWRLDGRRYWIMSPLYFIFILKKYLFFKMAKWIFIKYKKEVISFSFYNYNTRSYL
jgi:hypothetical protein